MREEYETIYRKYYSRVYSFISKLCGSRELSEDITQETFYQTFLSIHRFKGESDMFTFIAAIAKNTYYKYLRKNKYQSVTISLVDISDFLSDDGSGNPEYIYEQTSQRLDVRKLIERLPEKYRDVIFYRIYADMTFSQTAAAMGITENSAKVIFLRAKKKLTEELKNGDYL